MTVPEVCKKGGVSECGMTKKFLCLLVPLTMLMLLTSSIFHCKNVVELSTVEPVATSATTDPSLPILPPYLTCLSQLLTDTPSRLLGLVMYTLTYPTVLDEPPLSGRMQYTCHRWHFPYLNWMPYKSRT